MRDAREAARLAEHANAATGDKEAFVLDTLAMAYAEDSRFVEAQLTLQKAIDLATSAGDTDAVAAMQQRLRLYESGQPYRETFTNAGPEQGPR